VKEEEITEVLAAVLAGRPERILETSLAVSSPEMRAAFGQMADTVAALGRAADPVAPGAALRERILSSIANRKREAPRKALIVLDMINEHLTPGTPLEVPRARAIVPALKARIEAARASGTPVVYLIDEHDHDDADMDIVEGWGAHAMRGTASSEVWPELSPQAGDRVIKKATYSAFTGSELGQALDELRIDTLEMTGCLTELGMLATATDALQRGFAVEIPPATQAGASPVTESVAMNALAIMPPYGPARRARLETLAAR
jgi:nicotinamidase-related amidase